MKADQGINQCCKTDVPAGISPNDEVAAVSFEASDLSSEL
jgi:hypothetical protein